MEVMREDRTVEKNDSRRNGAGRRLGYLSILELANHNIILKKKFKVEKAYYVH